MEMYHGSSKTVKRGTGRKKRKLHDKRKRLIGKPAVNTKLDEEKEIKKKVRIKGGQTKIRLKYTQYANIATSNGSKKVKILNVVETPDNRHHVRQKIITKGTIIETEAGKAEVTNRVGQEGVINAKLIG